MFNREWKRALPLFLFVIEIKFLLKLIEKAVP